MKCVYRYVNLGPNFACHALWLSTIWVLGSLIRKIIWLVASRTNTDPAIVAGFFLKAIKQGGCPTILRTDKSTEGQDDHAGLDNILDTLYAITALYFNNRNGAVTL